MNGGRASIDSPMPASGGAPPQPLFPLATMFLSPPLKVATSLVPAGLGGKLAVRRAM